MNAFIARALISCLAVTFGLSAVQADDENPQRMTERDIVKQRVEVFRIALKGLLEAEKEDAADVIQRAIRAREVMIEGRRDDEAQRIRERVPNMEQLAKVLQVAAEVWREFDHEKRAKAVGRVAKELAEQAERRQRGRERAERSGRPTEREIVLRWIEVMRIAVPALGFKVARVVRVWPKVNKAKKPEALAGKTVVVGPANDLHVRFLSKLTPGQELTLEFRGGERNRFVITELTQQQRDMAKAE